MTSASPPGSVKKATMIHGGFCGGVKWARTIDLYDVNVTL